MAFFDTLTASLQQKWLQFFQINRSWIVRHMEIQYVDTPDGGRRPPSYLILGVANALEPRLAELMLPFSKLNPDVDALLDALELNFDPDLMLGNYSNTGANPSIPQAASDQVASMQQAPIYNVTMLETVSPLDEFSVMSLDDTTDVVLMESDDEPIIVLNVSDQDDFSVMSLDDTTDEVVLMESDDDMNVSELDDEFSVMSLNDLTDEGMSDDESMVLNVAELDELNEMLLDDTTDIGELGESHDQLETSGTTIQSDMFTDMSLDESDFTSPSEFDAEAKTPKEADAEDDLSNLWGEEKLTTPETNDENLSKEDKETEHEKEISRLFPNF